MGGKWPLYIVYSTVQKDQIFSQTKTTNNKIIANNFNIENRDFMQVSVLSMFGSVIGSLE